MKTDVSAGAALRDDLIVLSRTVLLLESTLTRITSAFSVFKTLSAHAKEVTQAATKSSSST